MMSPRTNAALKEWAIVCAALGDGRQIIVLRKGGILEVRRGFEVMHRDFWLFPTHVHQKAEDLVPGVRDEFAALEAPRPGGLDIGLYAHVTDEVKVTELTRVRALDGQHILSWDCVASRFRYRNRPGVHVLILRVSRLAVPARIPSKDWYDGCVSWVELDDPVEAAALAPVLPDVEFEARRRGILACLAGAAETCR